MLPQCGIRASEVTTMFRPNTPHAVRHQAPSPPEHEQRTSSGQMGGQNFGADLSSTDLLCTSLLPSLLTPRLITSGSQMRLPVLSPSCENPWLRVWTQDVPPREAFDAHEDLVAPKGLVLVVGVVDLDRAVPTSVSEELEAEVVLVRSLLHDSANVGGEIEVRGEIHERS
jgi:hypothetical protein